MQDGQGYFFTLMNSDKRSVMLDIRQDADALQFRELLKSTDVLIENLKPGALARRGFGPSVLADINPRLISCSVSGFGVHSLYTGRPAYDTVIQAMSGVMTTIRAGDVPVKTGISSADLLGAEFAIVAVLAALAARDRSGKGQIIDLSMQDIAAWMTQTLWTDPASGRDRVRIVSCRDGDLLVEAVSDAGAAELARLDDKSALTRNEFGERLDTCVLRTAPVLTVQEMLAAPCTASRRLWFNAPGSDGRIWPLLASPMRLSATPPQVRRPISRLGADNASVLGAPSAIETS
jgi:crotonobetainyl-CoA:carnitine CoA-transferase CaiB-like acyl-CoA transferase